jgi:hypothetical protein
MKKMIVFIIILLLVAKIFPTQNIQASYSGSSITIQPRNLLIAESSGRVIEVDSSGNIKWQRNAGDNVIDVERLFNGNTIITEFHNHKVIEVDSSGKIVWEMTGLGTPLDTERLANGNTLILEHRFPQTDRVFEVDNTRTIIWQKEGLRFPNDIERLANGNTLITELLRVIEVNTSGKIVWDTQDYGHILGNAWDAERLANGNTLITEYLKGRVIEINGSNPSEIVWEMTGLSYPYDAERLANGNTLIVELFNERIIEVDYNSKIIWELSGLWGPTDVEMVKSRFIDANINIDPDTLNLKSKGRWITCYITLNEPYDVVNIDISTILLEDTIPAEWGDIQGDRLMVKFDRSDVQAMFPVGTYNMKVTGELTDGTSFEGYSDEIRVIDPGK